MTEIDGEVKRWGNSYGIRLPKALAREAGVGPGDRVHVSLEKARDEFPPFWGLGKRLGFPPIRDFQEWKDAERRQERRIERRRLGRR